jgi:hypothetical protein
MRHAIETVILWAVTLAMLLYGLIGALVAWYERPAVGRHPNGSPRAVRTTERKDQ